MKVEDGQSYLLKWLQEQSTRCERELVYREGGGVVVVVVVLAYYGDARNP